MERTFAKEVELLRRGDGEHFEGEGILAITKGPNFSISPVAKT